MAQLTQTKTVKHELDEIQTTSDPNIRVYRNKRKRTESEDSSNEDCCPKFSLSDKIDLYNGLIQHGSSNISKLESCTSKKAEIIKRFIYAYKRKSRYTLSEGKPKAAIEQWLEFLIEDPNKEIEKINDLSRVLKYISLFEPRGAYNESILSECYLLLSDFMKGDAPKHLRPTHSLYMHKKIQEVIRLFKTQDKKAENKYLDACINNQKPICYSGKKKVDEGNTEINPRISNPLKIPDSLLELKK